MTQYFYIILGGTFLQANIRKNILLHINFSCKFLKNKYLTRSMTIEVYRT